MTHNTPVIYSIFTFYLFSGCDLQQTIKPIKTLDIDADAVQLKEKEDEKLMAAKNLQIRLKKLTELTQPSMLQGIESKRTRYDSLSFILFCTSMSKTYLKDIMKVIFMDFGKVH